MTQPAERQAYASFSHSQWAKIRRMMRVAGGPVTCPRCSAQLAIGAPLGASGPIAPVWEVRCEACHLHMLVRSLPPDRLPPKYNPVG